MGSTPRIQPPEGRNTFTKRPRNHRRATATIIDGGATVSNKLQALKSLIPSENAQINPDQLFQETADYIVRLQAQVIVLQQLIDLYGAQPREDHNAV